MKELFTMLIDKFCENMDETEIEYFTQAFQDSEVYKGMMEELDDMIDEYMDVLLDNHSEEIQEMINGKKKKEHSYNEELFNDVIKILDKAFDVSYQFTEWMKQNESIFEDKNCKLYDVAIMLETEKDIVDFHEFCNDSWQLWKDLCNEKDVEIRSIGRSQSRFKILPDNYRQAHDLYEELEMIYDGNSQFSKYGDFLINFITDTEVSSDDLTDINAAEEPIVPISRDLYMGYISSLKENLEKYKDNPKELYNFALKTYTDIFNNTDYCDEYDIKNLKENLTINDFLNDIRTTYKMIDDDTLKEWKEYFEDVIFVDKYYQDFKKNQTESFISFQKDRYEECRYYLDTMNKDESFFISAFDRIIIIRNSKNTKKLLEDFEKFLNDKDTTVGKIVNFLKSKNIEYTILAGIELDNDDMNGTFKGYRETNFKIPHLRGDNV